MLWNINCWYITHWKFYFLEWGYSWICDIKYFKETFLPGWTQRCASPMLGFKFDSYCTGGILWHLQKFLQYIIVESTPSSFSFTLLPPFLEQFQQVSFFHFHTWVHNISTITLLHLFFISSSLPMVPTPRQVLYSLISKEFQFYFWFAITQQWCDVRVIFPI
jgi:hypothetical protein